MHDEQDRLDPALEKFAADVGAGRVRRFEVRIEGDDGVLIGHGVYTPDEVAVRDASLMSEAMAQAVAQSAQPSHCARAAGGGRRVSARVAIGGWI